IPNLAQLVINDEPTDSNKVNVTTPQEKQKVLPNTNMDFGTSAGVATVIAISLIGVVVAVKRQKDSKEG
ncbi:MAG TPA: cell surface protein, partial [Enterococcus faecalis]|nr:cell surface protein [Enterococcus faecalis]